MRESVILLTIVIAFPMFASLGKNKNVIYELTRRQVKTQYRDSSLGFIWTVLNPLLNMLVMWLVFSNLFGQSDPFYPIYLLAGNIMFAALRNSTTQALQSFVGNRGLLLRTKIDPYVFPLSNVSASLINFGFSLVALLPFMIWLSIAQAINLFSYQLLFIFLMIPAFLLFEYGIGIFLATVFVFFRDIKHIYTVFLTLWTYLTPIFYKPITIARNANWLLTIIKINPMYQFTTYFRECVYGCAGAANLFGGEGTICGTLPEWSTLGWCYLSGFIALAIGLLVYKLCRSKIITGI